MERVSHRLIFVIFTIARSSRMINEEISLSLSRGTKEVAKHHYHTCAMISCLKISEVRMSEGCIVKPKRIMR